MKQMINFFLLFAIVICMFSHQNNAKSLVEVVCEHTHSKPNCLASFATNPDSQKADLTQLGVIALKLAAQNATDTSLYIKKLLANATLDPAIQQALEDCSDQYVDANQQIDDSTAALLVGKHKDVYTWTSAAIANAKTCEEGFKEGVGQDTILKQRNAMFRQLCNNVLAINKLLVKRSKKP